MKIYIQTKNTFFSRAILDICQDVFINIFPFSHERVQQTSYIQEAGLCITDLSSEGAFFRCMTISAQERIPGQSAYNLCFYDRNRYAPESFAACPLITSMVDSRDAVGDISRIIADMMLKVDAIDRRFLPRRCILTLCPRHMTHKDITFASCLVSGKTLASVSTAHMVPVKTLYSRRNRLMHRIGVIKTGDFYKLMQDIGIRGKKETAQVLSP